MKIERIVFIDPAMTPERAEHTRGLVVSAVRGLLAQQTLPEPAAPDNAGQAARGRAPSAQPRGEAGLVSRVAHGIARAVRDAR